MNSQTDIQLGWWSCWFHACCCLQLSFTASRDPLIWRCGTARHRSFVVYLALYWHVSRLRRSYCAFSQVVRARIVWNLSKYVKCFRLSSFDWSASTLLGASWRIQLNHGTISNTCLISTILSQMCISNVNFQNDNSFFPRGMNEPCTRF